MAFSLEVLAIHRLEVAEQVSVIPMGAARRAALDHEAVLRIEGYVADVDAREEALGKAVSAWWNAHQPDELRALSACPLEGFETASLEAMTRLQLVTPGSASGGVIIFARGSRDGTPALALFKMAPRGVTHTQFHPTAQAARAITVEELANVLPEPNELAKAAITPHPLGEASLRVVDVTTKGEPAGYWLTFLGAEQQPKEPMLTRMLVEASETALEAAGVPQHEVRAAVADRLEAVTEAGESFEPQQFVEDLARDTDQPPEMIWDQARAQRSDLASPRARISPQATQRLKTTIDLGEDISLSGPATLMRPPRVEIGQDDGGWFVKVRTSDQPRPRTK